MGCDFAGKAQQYIRSPNTEGDAKSLPTVETPASSLQWHQHVPALGWWQQPPRIQQRFLADLFLNPSKFM